MKKIVLIIDDNDKVRQTLEDRIVSMGFDFDPADCQMVAMSLLQKRRYDLILLDQELPIKKGKPTQKQVGRNLLEQIRECDNNHDTPVIIVTAHDGDNSSVVSDLMLNGASYFIHKPHLGILEEKIKAVLEKHKHKAAGMLRTIIVCCRPEDAAIDNNGRPDGSLSKIVVMVVRQTSDRAAAYTVLPGAANYDAEGTIIGDERLWDTVQFLVVDSEDAATAAASQLKGCEAGSSFVMTLRVSLDAMTSVMQ